MPELYVEFTDEEDDGALAARPVQDESEFFLPLFLPDSPDSPHLPEIYVEFTDEDEETGIFTSDLFFMLY